MRSSSSSGATSGTDPITRPGSADVRSQVQSRAERTTRARLTEHPRSAALLGGESDTDPAFGGNTRDDCGAADADPVPTELVQDRYVHLVSEEFHVRDLPREDS